MILSRDAELGEDQLGVFPGQQVALMHDCRKAAAMKIAQTVSS